MNKFTPAAWNYRPQPEDDHSDPRFSYWIDGPERVPIADIRNIEPKEAEANARLISAAPDLYEACQAFVTAWEECLQLEKTDVALRMAKEALRKVEGKL